MASPFWDPWVESGTPILTQVTPGLFHPLTLLYLAPFDLAFKLNHLLALPLAFASMVLLCRKTGASRWAAAAACAYAGSGWVVSMTSPAVQLERPAADWLRASFAASARSVLVIAEHYDTGWRATLDGAPAEVLQANLSALAVVVPAGAHAVELRYQPPWLLPGLLLALACALALGLLEFLEKDHRVGAAEAE